MPAWDYLKLPLIMTLFFCRIISDRHGFNKSNDIKIVPRNVAKAIQFHFLQIIALSVWKGVIINVSISILTTNKTVFNDLV